VRSAHGNSIDRIAFGPPPARAGLQDIGLARISQEVTATRARPRQGRSRRAETIIDQILSAASLLADQQKNPLGTLLQLGCNSNLKAFDPML
jgi:hypothetical protein